LLLLHPPLKLPMGLPEISWRVTVASLRDSFIFATAYQTFYAYWSSIPFQQSNIKQLLAQHIHTPSTVPCYLQYVQFLNIYGRGVQSASSYNCSPSQCSNMSEYWITKHSRRINSGPSHNLYYTNIQYYMWWSCDWLEILFSNQWCSISEPTKFSCGHCSHYRWVDHRITVYIYTMWPLCFFYW